MAKRKTSVLEDDMAKENQRITLYPGIHLGQTEEPIEFTSPATKLAPNQYQIWPYHFPDNKESNGGFFVLPPYAQIGVGLINEGTKVKLTVSHGSGLLPHTLDIWGNGQLTVYWDHIKNGDEFCFDTGDIYCLYAGPDGLIVQTKTTPPYQPDKSEFILPENDPRAPKTFWEILQSPYPDPHAIHILFPPLPCP